jgi:hypothetical protein
MNFVLMHRSHKQKAHLLRQLLFLQEGVDFIVSEGKRARGTLGKNPERQWLTVSAFKSICLSARTPIRKFLQDYFLFVEDQYRSNALHLIQRRRALQSPSTALKTEQMLLKMQHFAFRRGPCVYIIGVFEECGKAVHLKEGRCNDMNTRYPELVGQYYGFAVKVLFHMLTTNNPLAIEQCGFNDTPVPLKSPYDREIVDTPLETAIENVITCDRFMCDTTKRKESTRL